ncbi:MAG: hypothetical protein ABIG71_04535 [Candidatus Uhrbacteria bacterium]
MQEDQWRDTLDRISSQFEVHEQGTEDLEDVPNGRVAFVEFTAPIGLVRLEFVTKPRTVGEQAQVTRRSGATSNVKMLYDMEDMVSFLRAFQWNDMAETWEELQAGVEAFTV